MGNLKGSIYAFGVLGKIEPLTWDNMDISFDNDVITWDQDHIVIGLTLGVRAKEEGSSFGEAYVIGLLKGTGSLVGESNGSADLLLSIAIPKKAFSNGKATVFGVLSVKPRPNVENDCTYPITYKREKFYPVNYKQEVHLVNYKSKNYVVNYRCKNIRYEEV